jgi:hypothetical protein
MLNKTTSVFIASAMLLVTLAACQKTETAPAKGPAEQAGAQLDAAAAKAREKINEVGESAGKALQKAGEKGGEAVKKGGEQLEQASKEAQKKD